MKSLQSSILEVLYNRADIKSDIHEGFKQFKLRTDIKLSPALYALAKKIGYDKAIVDTIYQSSVEQNPKKTEEEILAGMEDAFTVIKKYMQKESVEELDEAFIDSYPVEWLIGVNPNSDSFQQDLVNGSYIGFSIAHTAEDAEKDFKSKNSKYKTYNLIVTRLKNLPSPVIEETLKDLIKKHESLLGALEKHKAEISKLPLNKREKGKVYKV